MLIWKECLLSYGLDTYDKNELCCMSVKEGLPDLFGIGTTPLHVFFCRGSINNNSSGFYLVLVNWQNLNFLRAQHVFCWDFSL